ncbi:PREDICTED: uncharacterized protein LOC105452220 isoform X1 [Wasmannia auropunctata]|uniref:uncharacterized protein LOC105452220 isoform X1 n=1 Tax=Wasmannia auropunctata TaxID=64793 RepID=UPI0005EF4DB8|nr:PREDICTED: uncharacterized protein LOC105452220 isoform X1 [Wasmannia auropunctata]
MYGLLCIISETIYFFEATSVLQNHIMQHAESRTTGARDMSLYYKTPLMFIVHVFPTASVDPSIVILKNPNPDLRREVSQATKLSGADGYFARPILCHTNAR